MNNTISENTKVALLLTSIFNSNEQRQCKPLTPNGYGYFAFWLNFHGYEPADLMLQDKLSAIFSHWSQADSHHIVKQKVALAKLDQTIRDITPTRIQTLLGRGASLSMALDKWTAAGIWILARSDNNYPKKIKQALKHQSPAILFGVGNVDLLAKPAIGFVGSRDCEAQDQNATTHYVSTINQNGFQVVSGAAKGVDSHAMLASLENGHSSIGIVAESLFKTSVNKQWRDHLKNEQLVLITPFYPESKFSAADAMQRNKFIYLLSSATVVVRSGDTGGTWKGAEENLKKGWVPLMVSEHKTPNYAANQKLLDGEIKSAKLTAQKITPAITADEFLQQLNEGQSQQRTVQLSQQTETPALQSSRDMFAEPSEPFTPKSQLQEKPLAYPQRPVRPASAGYADKDEIDVSAMAKLGESQVTEVTENSALVPAVETEPTSNTTTREIVTDTEAVVEAVQDPIEPLTTQTELIDSINGNPQEQVTEIEKTATLNPVIESLTPEDSVSNEPVTESKAGNFAEKVTDNVVAEIPTEITTELPTETTIEAAVNESADKPALTPTMATFYTQIVQLIEAKSNPVITYKELDEAFPELRLISKAALNKWIEYLVEQGYLSRPMPHRKEYCIAR